MKDKISKLFNWNNDQNFLIVKSLSLKKYKVISILILTYSLCCPLYAAAHLFYSKFAPCRFSVLIRLNLNFAQIPDIADLKPIVTQKVSQIL